LNLIEELAKQSDAKQCESCLLEDETCYDDSTPCNADVLNVKTKLLPIFAEWIKNIKNPYEKRDNTDISYGKEKGFDKAIETILSELEKMK
jgi:hypothetical protein